MRSCWQLMALGENLLFFLGERNGGDHCQALVDDPVSTSTQATLTRLGGLLKEGRGGGKEDKKSEGRCVGGVCRYVGGYDTSYTRMKWSESKFKSSCRWILKVRGQPGPQSWFQDS